MMIRIAIVSALAACVLWRAMMLVEASRRVAPTATLDRDSFASQVADSAAFLPFCFSPDAAVILSVGNDGQPGQADFDDNMNGIVDDTHEIGAVGSDDECLGPADDGYQEILSAPDTIAISRGTFVPCQESQTAKRYLTRELGWFVKE